MPHGPPPAPRATPDASRRPCSSPKLVPWQQWQQGAQPVDSMMQCLDLLCDVNACYAIKLCDAPL